MTERDARRSLAKPTTQASPDLPRRFERVLERRMNVRLRTVWQGRVGDSDERYKGGVERACTHRARLSRMPVAIKLNKVNNLSAA